MKNMKAVLAAALVLGVAATAGAVEIKEGYAAHGMVAAAHELASKAGVEIMKKGGNAIDAAVATALALNVVEFNANGIGGGGFTTFYSAKTKEVVCIDYREQAPASATKDMFASEQAKKEKWSEAGGKMTMEDLANYKVYVRKPVVGSYRGYKIYSVPPASSGGTHIVQLLNIMENYDVKGWGFWSTKKVHAFAEATRMMFADRSKYMADTAFAKVPLAGLQSKAYAKELANQITGVIREKIDAGDPWKFDNVDKTAYTAGMGDEHYSTSHFSVADAEGNVVASTNTINFFMGSCVYEPTYGFLLNDEMDDFSSNPESVNAPEPGKRPLSSMSPTIVLDPEGRPLMTLGSPGATRILTAVAQCIMNVVDHGMKMDEAIEAPRFHGQFAKQIRTENDRYDEKFNEELKAMGYEIKLQAPLYTGGAQGIMFNWDAKGTDKFLNGGADSRRLGFVVGF